MNVCSIVCEYNPMHTGHKYHIETTRSNLGVDAVVCIMSGDFVQRGEPAIADKWIRARCAVLSGADLVIELPTVYSLMSAQGFAFGAVSIASAIGSNYLSFGSECGSISELSDLSKAVSSPLFEDNLKESLSQGMAFPAAMHDAARRSGVLRHELLRAPNNTLAIEYLAALRSLQADIAPHTVKMKKTEQFMCASDIRAIIESEGLDAAKKYLSDDSFSLLKQAEEEGDFPVVPSSLDIPICTLLRSLSLSDIASVPDVSEGLEYTIIDASKNFASFSDIIHAIKSKRYSMARIKRIIMRILLGIRADYSKVPAPYIRVLEMNDIV